MKILRIVEDELDALDAVNDACIHAIKHFLSKKKTSAKQLDDDVCEADKLEDSIDELMMKLESSYYDNIFFPLSPDDRVIIAKDGDAIASALKSVISLLEYDGIVPIHSLDKELLRFAEKIHSIVARAAQMTRKFYKYEAEEYNLVDDYRAVSDAEREIDALLCSLLKKIPKFKKADPYNAILYRDLVLYCERVADGCMKAAENILVIHTKIT
ncbi:MAG: DUF47 family protein [archaeon]